MRLFYNMCVTESIQIAREMYDQGYKNDDFDDKWFNSSFLDAIARYDLIGEYSSDMISDLLTKFGETISCI